MNELQHAFSVFEKSMKDDPDYLWSFHCNVAMPIFDSVGISHKDANIAAARIMKHLFGVNVTTHPHYIQLMEKFEEESI
tara:strand:+ start:202 stop:438 length:237 start_codon:yes stop_codon:yes gene_type:complete